MTRINLRGSEYEIRFSHKTTRLNDPVFKAKYPVKHGGTECWIFEDGIYFSHGESWLNVNDNFCRRTGIKISLARALMKTDFTKEERREIWWKVLNYKPKENPTIWSCLTDYEMGKVEELQAPSEQSERTGDSQQFSVRNRTEKSDVVISEVARSNSFFNSRWGRISKALFDLVHSGIRKSD